MSAVVEHQTVAHPPAPMSETALRQLKRPALQAIAKAHGVKANLKNDLIIKRLVAKDVREAQMPSSAPQKQTKRPKTKAGIKREAEDVRYRPADVDTAQTWGSPMARVQEWTSHNAIPFKGPSAKASDLVQQKVTHLVNAGPDIDAKLRDIEALSVRTGEMLEEGKESQEYLNSLRRVLDVNFIARMRGDPNIWAGAEAKGKKEELERERRINEEQSVNPNPRSESEEYSPESEEAPSPLGGSAESYAEGPRTAQTPKTGNRKDMDENPISQSSPSSGGKGQQLLSSGGRGKKRVRQEDEAEVDIRPPKHGRM